MQQRGTIKLSQFVDLLEANYREVNYVLERGFVPEGVNPAPSTGNHRAFDPGQAYWLAIILLLKRSGIRVPQAAELANLIREGIRTIARNLVWDWNFDPWTGLYDTEHQYFAEIGDSDWLRLLTDANPSQRGIHPVGNWIGPRRQHRSAAEWRPFVTIRIDLTHLAQILNRAPWSQE